MQAELVARIESGAGSELSVLRAPGLVGITDGSKLQSGHTMRTDAARELVGLLDRALEHDAPREVIGCVTQADGRKLYVKRWPYAVSLTEAPDEHTGWTWRLIDQVRAARDAIDSATRDPIAA